MWQDGAVCSSTPLLVADEVYAQPSDQRRTPVLLVFLSVFCRRCRYNEDICQATLSKRETIEAPITTFPNPRG